MPYFEKLQLKLFEEFEIGSMKLKIKDIEEMKTVIQDNFEKIEEQKIELNVTKAKLDEQKLGKNLTTLPYLVAAIAAATANNGTGNEDKIMVEMKDSRA